MHFIPTFSSPSDYGAAAPWNDSSVRGCKRFLESCRTDRYHDRRSRQPRIWRLRSKAIKKVSSDIEAMKFNTAIACLMTLIRDLCCWQDQQDDLVIFIKLLCPFTSSLRGNLETIGGEGLLSLSQWPEYEEQDCRGLHRNRCQVNGKVRGTVVIPNSCAKLLSWRRRMRE